MAKNKTPKRKNAVTITTCKYPDIVVHLIGATGDMWSVVGQVRRAMMNANVPDDTIAVFVREATAGNYNHMIRVCMAWVNIE